MSIVVDIVVPAEEFVLGNAVNADSDVQIELNPVVPVGSSVIPYLWVRDYNDDDIVTELRADPDVESVTVVDQFNGDALIRVDWRNELDGCLDALIASEGAILEAVGGSDVWRIQLLFEDRDHLTTFYRQCNEHGISVEIRRIHSSDRPDEKGGGSSRLTDAQYEILLAALEQGYFDVPRQIDLRDLAEEFEISDTAVSQRLRRGLSTLLSETLPEVQWEAVEVLSETPADES